MQIFYLYFAYPILLLLVFANASSYIRSDISNLNLHTLKNILKQKKKTFYNEATNRFSQKKKKKKREHDKEISKIQKGQYSTHKIRF